MNRLRQLLLLAGAVVMPSMASGCINPFAMGFFTPVPMQPWVADRIEERLVNKNDHRTPILPPIPPGHRPLCEDPPDKAEILRTMPRVTRGVPYVYEEFRDDIDVTVEKLVDIVDPPRFFPLIGPAQVHHCHWKCTVYYTETISSDYPFPFRAKRRRIEVVYIDKDHLHQCITGEDARASVTRDLIGAPVMNVTVNCEPLTYVDSDPSTGGNRPRTSEAGADDTLGTTMHTFSSRQRWLALLLLLGVAGLFAAPLLAAEGPFGRLFDWMGAKTPEPVRRGANQDSHRYLEIAVELAWMADPLTFPYFLEARADKNLLEVRGYVPSRVVREQVLKIASLNCPLNLVDGMREHPSLAVRPSQLPPAQLQAAVHTALKEAYPKSHPHLGVQCSGDGTVTLLGSVRSFEEKLALSLAMRRLHGCTAVRNRLDVITDSPLPRAPEIRQLEPFVAAKVAPSPVREVIRSATPLAPASPSASLPKTPEIKRVEAIPSVTTASPPLRAAATPVTLLAPAAPERKAPPAVAPAILPIVHLQPADQEPMTLPACARLGLPTIGQEALPARKPVAPTTASKVLAPPVPTPTVAKNAQPARVTHPSSEVFTIGQSEAQAGNPLTVRLTKQILQACPAATNVEVRQTDTQTLSVQLQVRTDEELRDYAGRIYSLEDLQAYRTDMHITIEP